MTSPKCTLSFVVLYYLVYRFKNTIFNYMKNWNKGKGPDSWRIVEWDEKESRIRLSTVMPCKNHHVHAPLEDPENKITLKTKKTLQRTPLNHPQNRSDPLLPSKQPAPSRRYRRPAQNGRRRAAPATGRPPPAQNSRRRSAQPPGATSSREQPSLPPGAASAPVGSNHPHRTILPPATGRRLCSSRRWLPPGTPLLLLCCQWATAYGDFAWPVRLASQ
jgi:hypothetical protein